MTIGLLIWGLGHAVMNPHAHAWLIAEVFRCLRSRPRNRGAPREGAIAGGINIDGLACHWYRGGSNKPQLLLSRVDRGRRSNLRIMW